MLNSDGRLCIETAYMLQDNAEAYEVIGLLMKMEAEISVWRKKKPFKKRRRKLNNMIDQLLTHYITDLRIS